MFFLDFASLLSPFVLSSFLPFISLCFVLGSNIYSLTTRVHTFNLDTVCTSYYVFVGCGDTDCDGIGSALADAALATQSCTRGFTAPNVQRESAASC